MAELMDTLFEIQISSENLKVLSCIVNLILKVGKELIIEVEEDAVIFRALNDGKSAFVAIDFKPSYFTIIEPPPASFSCKLSVKPICAILKNLRNVLYLIIRAETIGSEHDLVFEARYGNGLKRTHRFSYQDCDIISALFDEDTSSYLQSEPKVFTQLLDHIYQSPEIIVDASSNTFRVRSFHSEQLHDTKRHLSTGLSIDVKEFDLYEFKGGEEVSEELIFCSKEVGQIRFD